MAGHHGSPTFEAYTRNLRRIYWAEFVDAQIAAARPLSFRASLVADPMPEKDSLANTYEYHRHRVAPANAD